MARYQLSSDAEDDLKRIYDYGLKTFGEKQADLYLDQLLDCFDTIADSPFSFVLVDNIYPGLRRCVCGVDSIFFRIGKDLIEIVAIIGRQELNQALNK